MIAAPHIYRDRTAAGIELAQELLSRGLPGPSLVLALPRGGVPVGHEVARALRVPLDVMVVRKLGMPGQPELAIGAIASGGIIVGEPETFVSEPILASLMQHERAELRRREHAYRGTSSPLELTNRTVLLVDDGLATGSTMLAAIRAARKAGAATVIAAAPVASDSAAARVAAEADHVLFLQIPESLYAIGQWYDRFDQLHDDEVQHLLRTANRDAAA